MRWGLNPMGEIAELMINGALCEECGDFIENAPGHPRLCEDCADCEGGEAFSSSKWTRIEDAKRDFKEAATLAAQHGMTLTRHNAHSPQRRCPVQPADLGMGAANLPRQPAAVQPEEEARPEAGLRWSVLEPRGCPLGGH